jgi:hypothetical protein
VTQAMKKKFLSLIFSVLLLPVTLPAYAQQEKKVRRVGMVLSGFHRQFENSQADRHNDTAEPIGEGGSGDQMKLSDVSYQFSEEMLERKQ